MKTKNAAEQKCSTIQQELEQVKKDLADARQANKQNEAEKSEKSDTDIAKVKNELGAVRRLARQYRDKAIATETSEKQLKVNLKVVK